MFVVCCFGVCDLLCDVNCFVFVVGCSLFSGVVRCLQFLGCLVVGCYVYRLSCVLFVACCLLTVVR